MKLSKKSLSLLLARLFSLLISPCTLAWHGTAWHGWLAGSRDLTLPGLPGRHGAASTASVQGHLGAVKPTAWGVFLPIAVIFFFKLTNSCGCRFLSLLPEPIVALVFRPKIRPGISGSLRFPPSFVLTGPSYEITAQGKKEHKKMTDPFEEIG